MHSECCSYYRSARNKFSLIQRVEKASTLCNSEMRVAGVVIRAIFSLQLETQQCCSNSLLVYHTYSRPPISNVDDVIICSHNNLLDPSPRSIQFGECDCGRTKPVYFPNFSIMAFTLISCKNIKVRPTIFSNFITSFLTKSQNNITQLHKDLSILKYTPNLKKVVITI